MTWIEETFNALIAQYQTRRDDPEQYPGDEPEEILFAQLDYLFEVAQQLDADEAQIEGR